MAEPPADPPESAAPPPDAAPPAAEPPVGGTKKPVPQRPGAGPRPWQGGRFAPTTTRGTSRRSRWWSILVLLFIILGLGGAVLAWFLYLGSVPHAHFEAIVVDQYRDTRVPASRWTAQDGKGLRARGWQDANGFTSQQGNLLIGELKNLGRTQPADQPLVIYLCGYAATLSDGSPALLPGDAQLDDETTWLPLRDVLNYVHECPVHNRLLLLDLAAPFADARAGAVLDDTATRVAPLVHDMTDADHDLLVLCACSPGQHSLASEELGHTVFAHYLIQGLMGKADGWNKEHHQDNRVSARELAAFVTVQVDRWASHNQGLRQTPELFGFAADFPLLAIETNPPPESGALDATYPAGLKKSWELRDAWTADPLVRTPPDLVRDLETAVLHAEERWRGGAKAEDVETDLGGQVGRLEARRNTLPGASDRRPPRSLAAAVARGAKPPPGRLDEPLRKLKRLSELHGAAASPMKDKDPEAVAQLETRKKDFLGPFDGKPFELAWTVFHAAKDDPDLRPEDVRYWVELLRPEGKPIPDYAEIHYLEDLAALEVKDPKTDWSAGAVAVALQLCDEAEQAESELALAKPGTLRWLLDFLTTWRDQAGDHRTAAEALLFKAKPADRGKALPALQAVLADDHGYPALKDDLKILRAALRARDGALAFLPGYLPWLEQDPRLEGDWTRAVEQARALRDLLTKPPAEGASLDLFPRMDAQARALRTVLDNLRQPMDSSRLDLLIRQRSRAGGADAMEMSTLLKLPALPRPDRLSLWAGWRETAGRLNEETGLAPPEGGDSPASLDADKAGRQERERGLLRARTALALLTLDGPADVHDVEATLKQTAADPTNAKLWRDLARKLREAGKK